MDERIRRLQRQVAIGDAPVESLDRVLIQSGYIHIGNTSSYGSRPGEAIFLRPISETFYQIAIREPDSQIRFFMEEVDEPGEHVGEYPETEAFALAQEYIVAVEPQWAAGERCADPLCLGNRVIVESVINDPIDSYQINYRCVDCDNQWLDYVS